ncbi:PilW family protein [Marinobacter sp. HL-58]|uniref:PilW family protein n=1 Tax=Marinobacter sp. HL-58 TaxID=1479237 RepID=UPI00068D2676|nr:PilW family protein [Marinobacter sp. HL-58]KPQ01847.1 MAG: T4SS system assembly protein PilW [Marinobacter sp. HL-58]
MSKRKAVMSTMKCPGAGLSGMRGLSLIELMIAMLLGLILTLGVVQVYLGSSQTYRLTDAIAHAQENIRFAATMIERDVRGAGGLSCLQNASDVEVKLQGDRVVELANGLLGWEFDGTGPGEDFGASDELEGAGSGNWLEGPGDGEFPPEIAGEVMSGTDVLIVNSLQTIPVDITGSATGSISLDGASDIPVGRIVLSIDDNCASGELFQNANNETANSVAMAGSGFDPGNIPSSGFELSYGANARVAAHNTFAYYVGIGASGEPALMRQRLDAEPSNPEELVEGVETMQVMYGIAPPSGSRNEVDQYVTAENVADWAEVLSVRLAFLVRSSENATGETQTRDFNLAGTVISSPEDRRARLVSTMTVGIRNRLE